MVVILLMGGFVPTPEPKSPDEWGEPLFTENPNAPLYPAGKQYTWLMLPDDGGLNVEIVQSLTIRTSHQFSKFSLASSTLNIADIFNMQQSRMDQAIELLDEQIVFISWEQGGLRLLSLPRPWRFFSQRWRKLMWRLC